MTPIATLTQALETADELFNRKMVESAIADIAMQIRNDYLSERPLVLTVMHGGMFFSSLLALALGIDAEFDYLHATRYRGQTTGSGLAWLHRPATAVEGRRVLIADDILDEGHTLRAIVHWCEDQGAADVKVAVMCRKVHDRCVEGVYADYIALDVPDRYVFGFGMDYYEQGRNLPGIYALSEG